MDCGEAQIRLSHQRRKKDAGVDSVFDVLPSNCAGQNLKKEAATGIRMHAVVLISAELTHAGPASKSNQGEGRQQKLIMHLFSSSVHSFFFSLSRQKLKG